MQEHVLIANLGWRGLVFRQGEEYLEIREEVPALKEWVGDAPFSFQALTRAVVEDPQLPPTQYAQHFSVNILGRLFKQLQHKVSCCYLFVSDQLYSSPQEKARDTHYAGQILQHLIREAYGIPVVLKVIQANVSLPDELIPVYQREIVEIQHAHPERELHFHICHSGGTAQQTAALQLAVEFLLRREVCTFYQMGEIWENGALKLGPDSSLVNQMQETRFKEVIDDIQSLRLIDHGEYNAAAELQRSLGGDQKTQSVTRVIKFFHYRLQAHPYPARKVAEKLSVIREDPMAKCIQEYYQRIPLGNNYPDWEAYLMEGHYFLLCELLSIADYYWILGRYAESVLFHHIFMEQTLRSVLAKLGPQLRPPLPQLVNLMVESYPDRRAAEKALKQYTNGAISTTVPSMLRFLARELSNPAEPLNSLLQEMESARQTLGPKRNDFAHTGKPVSLAMLERANPVFCQQHRHHWKQYLGLPTEPADNVFCQGNALIKRLMKYDKIL